MRSFLFSLSAVAVLLFWSAGCSSTEQTVMTEEPSEPAPGEWITLYDGSSLEGWQMTGPGGFVQESDGSILSQGGMGLFYYNEQAFEDFELELEWKTEKDSTNSGIFVRFPDAPDPWYAVNTGYEIQIDDSQDPVHQTGAVYSFSSPFKLASRPVGEWNQYRIRVTGQRYQIFLNGEQVNDFVGNRSLSGYIGLQNHDDGSKAWFRNIRVKPIEAPEAPTDLADLFRVDGTPEPIRVLMVTATNGFRHAPAIDTSKAVMMALDESTEFDFDITEDLTDLNANNLAGYDLLFFANSTLRADDDINAEQAEEAAQAEADLYKGTFANYQLMMTTPQGEFPARLELSGEADNLTGVITFGFSPDPVELTDVALNGDQLSFNFTQAMMGDVNAALTVDGSSLDGSFKIQGTDIPVKGSEPGAPTAEETTGDAFTGDVWNLDLNTPQGTMEMTLEIDMETLRGRIMSQMNPSGTQLEDVSMDGDTLAFSFDGGQFGQIASRAGINGDEINGFFTAGPNRVPYQGTRGRVETISDAPRLTADQRQAVLDFLSAGKGIVAAHAALDALYAWDEYRAIMGGGLFEEHPWTQSVRIVIEEPENPTVSHFDDGFWIRDEIYVLDENPRWNARVLASLDMSSVGIPEGPADQTVNDHPISWIRNHNGGRVFVTKLGHFPDVWTTPGFIQHLLQGMRMAAGRIEGDISGHRVKEVIAEGVWPDDIAVDDRGNVWIAELRGKVHFYDAAADSVWQVAEVPTTDPTKIEHGLYGIEVDPNFYSGEPYVYMYYAEQQTFINTLSRFEYRNGQIDLSTEHVLLRVPTEPHCCHQAGDLEWGPDGTLYLSTGDTGMSETRPDWELSDEQIEAFKEKYNLKDIHWSRLVDSERSAQNLQDLRGKILRINKDGTIPEDNPFYGETGVRWEIYAYGLRNPYRFKVDPETSALYIGVVGPDAQYDYDEYNISVKGGENFGWPRTLGRLFFNEWTPDMIPNYVPPIWEYTYETGGRSATVGPVYRHTGPGAFPAAFQNKVFIFDWARRWIKWADVGPSRFTNDRGADQHNDPLQVDMPAMRLLNIKTFDQLTNTAPISMELSPDGSIYVAEFDGFWDAGPNARVTRYRWVTGEDTAANEADELP